MKKKYDLVFGIGAACSCSQMLRKTGLQFSSYPFDWLYGTDFSGRVDILTNDFKDFVNKEDLTFIDATNGDKDNPCDVYNNVKKASRSITIFRKECLWNNRTPRSKPNTTAESIVC